MDNFGETVKDVLIDIDDLRNKILNGQLSSITTQGLLCDSKKRVVDRYLTAIGNSVIMLASVCQLLILLKTTDDVSKRIFNVKKLLRDSFNHDIINAIQSDEHCSGCPKASVLFAIMQNQLEDVFFSDLVNRLIPFIGSLNGEKHDVCKEILDEYLEFTEAALLHLSGLRINCANLKDEIFDDDRFPANRSDIRRLGPDYIDIPDMPPGTCLFKDDTKTECLHIFLHDGMLKVKTWMDVYTNLYTQYHKYPKRINLILDYKLVSEYEWTKKDTERYNHLKEIFGKVFIINTESVEFQVDINELNITQLSKIKECFIQCDS